MNIKITNIINLFKKKNFVEAKSKCIEIVYLSYSFVHTLLFISVNFTTILSVKVKTYIFF